MLGKLGKLVVLAGAVEAARRYAKTNPDAVGKIADSGRSSRRPVHQGQVQQPDRRRGAQGSGHHWPRLVHAGPRSGSEVGPVEPVHHGDLFDGPAAGPRRPFTTMCPSEGVARPQVAETWAVRSG